jgi:hypothetical protein
MSEYKSLDNMKQETFSKMLRLFAMLHCYELITPAWTTCSAAAATAA